MSFLDLWSMCAPTQRQRLSEGSTRRVFVLKACPDVVFKQAINPLNGQQRNEWKTWLYCQDNPELAQHLAPCLECAPDFSLLVMARTRAPSGFCGSAWQYPKVPHWLAVDLHTDNVGEYQGRVVMHDYGYLENVPAPLALDACR